MTMRKCKALGRKLLVVLFIATLLFSDLQPVAVTIDWSSKSVDTTKLEPATNLEIDVEIPPAIIYEDEIESYRYIPKEERLEAGNAEVSQIEPETPNISALSSVERAEIQQVMALLEEHDSFSALSEQDQADLCKYMKVNESALATLEENEKTLSGSILYAQLEYSYGFTVPDLLANCPASEDCTKLFTEMAKYTSFLAEEHKGTSLDYELREYILNGAGFEQVKTAYALSKRLGIEMDTLLIAGGAADGLLAGGRSTGKLNDDSTLSKSDQLSAVDQENYALFSEDLGVSEEALIEYADSNNVSFQELEGLVEEGSIYALALSDPEEYAAMMTMAAGVSDDEGGGDAKYGYNVSSPYSYQYDQNESVNLNTGALVYETTDAVLPGINGLDLVIGRRYDSSKATYYNPTTKPTTVYYVNYQWQAYYDVVGTGVGRWEYYDTPKYREGPFYSYAEAERFAQLNVIMEYRENKGGGVTLILTPVWSYEAEQIEPLLCSYTVNSYFNDLYGLGLGWQFMFSSIQDGKYLHLSDGRTYEMIDIPHSGYVTLKDYTLFPAMHLEKESGIYFYGGVSSAYTLYYEDGKREYFSSDGKLIGIQDRFYNTIKFQYSTYNGLPYTTITDTAGRTVTISGEKLSSGSFVVTVTLPDSTLRYELAKETANRTLTAFENQMGLRTNYSYTYQTGGYNTVKKATDYTPLNRFYNLTTITHPTGAKTIYSYESFVQNLGSLGLETRYRVKWRADRIGSTDYNNLTYTYPGDNSTGYPSYKDPDKLPGDFTYSTIVTETATGLKTKSVFDYRHLLITTESTEGSVLHSQNIRYNENKLPTDTSIEKYNTATGASTWKALSTCVYDRKGNVTESWSPLAYGVSNDNDYKTTYTYDWYYNLPLTVTYKQDANTTVTKKNTLSPDSKTVTKEEIFVNNVLKHKTEYTYDSYGRVKSMSVSSADDGFSQIFKTTYSYTGAILMQVETDGVRDADNNLASGTTSAGTILSKNEYDTMGRLIKSTDKNNNAAKYEYDKLGNLTKQTNPDNTTVQYDLNYKGNTLTVTDENGNSIRYAYTALGLLYEVIDHQTDAVITRNEYDSMSRLVKETDFVYGGVKEYTYDQMSRVTSITAKGGLTALTKETYAYTFSVADGEATTKTVVGDSSSPSIVTTKYFNCMDLVYKEVCNTSSSINTYDYVGNLIKVKQDGRNFYSSQMTYDYAGRVVKAINADGGSTSSAYNALGNVSSTTDYLGTKTTYTYDGLGRKIQESSPIDSGNNSSTKYYYDAAGNVTSARSANNQIGSVATWSRTDYSYDTCGRQTFTTAYNGSAIDNVTGYNYDKAGNLLKMTTGLSSKTASDGVATTYTYDRFGNATTMKDPLGQTEQYGYSALGKPTNKIDRNGDATTYTYDALGRITLTSAVKNGKQGIKKYTYTLTGAVKSEENGNISVSYTYDSWGSLTKETQSDGVTKEYGYDNYGNRTSFHVKRNSSAVQSLTYTYDNQDRLKTVSENGTVHATYAYDANGNLQSVSNKNGTSEAYSYNKANWVTGVTNKSGSNAQSTYSYTYYADGNQRTKTDNTGSTATYGYDGLGRLKSESGGGKTISYSYDRFSNRTGMNVTGNEVSKTTYSYDANNRLKYETRYENDITTKTIHQYDKNGNLTAEKSQIEEGRANLVSFTPMEVMEYNGFNELTKVTGEKTVSYTYNPSGLRLSKTVDGVKTDFVLDGGNVIAEYKGDVRQSQYIWGLNLVYSEIGTDNNYYHYNGHGDVVQLTNQSGAVRKSYEYDAFGVEVTPSDSDSNPFRYSGEYFDSSSGTYYLRARYYDPGMGRFTQEDPANNGLNWYTYCANDPINRIDPSGLADVLLRFIAEKNGLSVEWVDNVYFFGLLKIGGYAVVRDGNGNSKEYRGKIVEGRMLVDDAQFGEDWGITDQSMLSHQAGDPFSREVDAALAFGLQYMSTSISEEQEYGGYIFKDSNANYYFDNVIKSSDFAKNPNNMTMEERNRLKYDPDKGHVAFIHTHWLSDKKSDHYNPKFSGVDYNPQVNIYLVNFNYAMYYAKLNRTLYNINSTRVGHDKATRIIKKITS